MKKVILIIGTVVLTVLNLNATTNKSLNINNVSATISKDNIIKIYDWSVKTIKGEYSGTALSLFDAKKAINLCARDANIQDMKIESYYILKSQLNNKKSRVYYWEVESTNGNAKGFSTSENNAERMIRLVAKGDIITFKIIKSDLF